MGLLGKPSAQDMDTFPHVFLAGQHEWEPSVLDYTHPDDSYDFSLAPDPSKLKTRST